MCSWRWWILWDHSSGIYCLPDNGQWKFTKSQRGDYIQQRLRGRLNPTTSNTSPQSILQSDRLLKGSTYQTKCAGSLHMLHSCQENKNPSCWSWSLCCCQLPSCEEVMEWAHVVLETSPESADLSAKALLAQVTVEKVQTEISRMKKLLAIM